MKNLGVTLFLFLAAVSFLFSQGSNEVEVAVEDHGQSIYEYSVKDWQGNLQPLEQFRNAVVLVVNTATNCGFAPQLKGMQELYEKYAQQGLVVLSFPANNFLGQEPFGNLRIRQMAEEKYKITFPQMEKISVKGSDMHPLYRFLTSPSQPKGISGEISWNFNKFVIGRDGKVLARFDSSVDPLSPEVLRAIDGALGQP